MSFLRRFFYRLIGRPLKDPVRCDSTGSFEHIPHEIILGIIDYLPGESIIMFALTCRRYYGALRNNLPRLQTRRELEPFLQILEKDTPGRYFCHECTILHPHHPKRIGEEPPCLGHFGVKLYPEKVKWNSEISLGFGEAHLVMNRHLYGDAHG